MSLDVYLIENEPNQNTGTGIFVKHNGRIFEISREEWDEKFPDWEPVIDDDEQENNEVYWANITHNLSEMARQADLYEYLWSPYNHGIKYANELIEPLETGLEKLLQNPEYYKHFNPPNGWGDYDGLVEFVSNYIVACKNHPDATIDIIKIG